jgi:hypothetical protein
LDIEDGSHILKEGSREMECALGSPGTPPWLQVMEDSLSGAGYTGEVVF